MYDFSLTGSGVLVPSVSGAVEAYSGTLSSLGNFYQGLGSGYFTGQNIEINNTDSGLYSGDWTMFFVYDKTQTGDNVLFSNFHTGLVNGLPANKGFVIGINTSNKLFFESFDNNGSYIKTFNKILGSKNVIAVTHSINDVAFSYLNFTTRDVETENFSINSAFLFPSTGWNLGAAISAPSFFSGNPFVGYLDEFVYINQAITPSNIKTVMSGFFTDVIDPMPIISINTGSQVTGFGTSGVILGTGITGSQVTGIGVLIDNCGNQTQLYTTQDLTGIISGSVIIPLYGDFIFEVTGYTPVEFQVNSGYIDEFGMQGVTYLRNINTGDLSELRANKRVRSHVRFNLLGSYDFVESKFKLDNNYLAGDVNVYLNGVGQVPSGYLVTGGVYTSGLYLSGDYFIDLPYLQTTGFTSGDDTIIYDVISGVKNATLMFSHGTGSGDQGFSGANELWFLNGIKLVSGTSTDVTNGFASYFTSGDSIVFLGGVSVFDGSQGLLLSFPNESGFTGYSGIFATAIVPEKFLRGFSRLWMNGQRQKIGNNYIEISNVDLFNASGIFNNDLPILYDNTQDFFE